MDIFLGILVLVFVAAAAFAGPSRGDGYRPPEGPRPPLPVTGSAVRKPD